MAITEAWRWLEIVSTNLVHDPSVRGVVSNARDVTDTRRVQDQLAHQASHDALTGLANRALFNDRTELAEITANIPLGEIPPQEDVAEAIVFFASGMSRMITGQALDVNGGEFFG